MLGKGGRKPHLSRFAYQHKSKRPVERCSCALVEAMPTDPFVNRAFEPSGTRISRIRSELRPSLALLLQVAQEKVDI
ncbi:hypothetical protein GCM10009425_49490 [Pseudomonas asuensis]|uniref:Uncharacterized protein n=1 Tax=Pseudomonas asuensis TaxID=1825787 RepID=A0ABQ2H5B5_9PSED|nr:hypothetical protein GCM10009425_49490 [Pseudomonas asuensis]